MSNGNESREFEARRTTRLPGRTVEVEFCDPPRARRAASCIPCWVAQLLRWYVYFSLCGGQLKWLPAKGGFGGAEPGWETRKDAGGAPPPFTTRAAKVGRLLRRRWKSSHRKRENPAAEPLSLRNALRTTRSTYSRSRMRRWAFPGCRSTPGCGSGSRRRGWCSCRCRSSTCTWRCSWRWRRSNTAALPWCLDCDSHWRAGLKEAYCRVSILWRLVGIKPEAI